MAQIQRDAGNIPGRFWSTDLLAAHRSRAVSCPAIASQKDVYLETVEAARLLSSRSLVEGTSWGGVGEHPASVPQGAVVGGIGGGRLERV